MKKISYKKMADTIIAKKKRAKTYASSACQNDWHPQSYDQPI